MPKQRAHRLLLLLFIVWADVASTLPSPSITTLQPSSNQNDPSTSTRYQVSNKCNANVAKSLHFELPLETVDHSKLDAREIYTEINCPLRQAVKIRSGWQNDPIAQRVAEDIRNSLKVCSWFKDGKQLHRDNGNLLYHSANVENDAIAFIRPTKSDEGLLTCNIDYSALLNNTLFPLDPKILARFELHDSIEFTLELDDMTGLNPDIAPKITHPPFPTLASRGESVEFTCTSISTQLEQRIDWFRSNCNNSDAETYNDCKGKFFTAVELTNEEQKELDPMSRLKYMRPYFIEDEDGDTYRIKNVTEDNVDTYGCLVSNDLGLDIRTANLTLDNLTVFSDRRLKADFVHQSDQYGGGSIKAAIIYTFIAIALFILFYVTCFTEFGPRLFKHSPLLKQIKLDESIKEDTGRQHLPKVDTPNIYNCNSDENCIYGHYHHKSNLLPSMCSPNIVMEKNLSISSNNYQSDESSSWGKSLSSSGEPSRSFYQHTSNNTATTVPVYAIPSTTGTTQPNGALVQGSCVINPTYGFIRPDFNATFSKWTFSRRNLEPQKMIGKGQFGEVWRYVAHQKDGTASFVAVKKLNVRLGRDEEQAKDEILKEIEIMKCVNDHPNVIKFLNTCIEPTQVLLIMEYAENGTLQSYLRKSRYAKDKRDASVTSKELLKYSYHVAKGMEYIASRGIVHRDLATRNVLLSKEKTCKIADFGLARFVNDTGIYQRLDRNQPVPIKWMAPESLSEYGTYTSKSDVFSMGVLMWEIVTLGATPYDFLQTNEVLKKVVSGERLSRPEHCKEEFYSIMDRCWHQDPAQRPTFKELADDLEVLLQSENDYIQLDKYPEHAYYNINTSINAEKEMVTSLPFYPELDNVFH